MTQRLVIAIALVLLAAGCGSGSGSDDRSESTLVPVAPEGELNSKEQALADQIASDTAAGGELNVPAQDARCWAEELVGDLGIDGLAAIGVTPGGADLTTVDVDATTGATLVESLAGCTDLKDLFGSMLTTGAESALDSGTADCILAAITDADLKELIALGFVEEPAAATSEVEARLSQAFADCLPD